MYTAIFAGIYLLINFKKLKSIQILKRLVTSLILILCITSFFWMPLLEHKINVDYEVFKPGRMERTEVLIAYKLNFDELFFTFNKNYMIYEIGWVTVIALIATPIALKYLRKNRKSAFYKLYLFSLISGLGCLVMTLNIFPYENLPSILKMIQFTFRLLEFTSFFFSFIAAVNIATLIPKKIKMIDVCVILVLLMLLSMFYLEHLHYLDEPFDENRLWPAVKVTSNTGRVHAGLASFEYLPCKAFENRSYIETRTNDAIILSGTANITNQNKNGSKMTFDIENVTEETIIELPYIYYLGYEVKAIENNKVTILETTESDNGFMQIKVNNIDNAKVNVSYEGTFIMKISRVISILGFLSISLIVILNIHYKRNNNFKLYK